MASVAHAPEPEDSASLVTASQSLQPKTPTEDRKSFLEPSLSFDPAASLQTPQAERIDRGKQTPPPAPTSSMTPPPSTQIPTADPPITRTPAQAASVLSSPPPTSRAAEVVAPSATSTISVTENHIFAADLNELRSIASNLVRDLKETRTSVAHHKFQYEMACIENSENAARMAVELSMAQREVDVLQGNEVRRQEAAAVMNTPSWQSANSSPYDASYVNDLVRRIQGLNAENHRSQNMLKHAKRIITDQDGEISSLLEQNDQLRSRIRENREHVNRMRRANGLGIFEATPRSEGLTTPYQQTPIRHNAHAPNSQSIDTLLLADRMLSEASRTQTSRPRSGHTRNAHSVPSVPSTPSRTRTLTAASAANFRTPQAPSKAAASISAPHTAPVARYKPIARHHHHKRANSESTISETDDDRTNEGISDNDEVPESQASRSATDLLRRSMTSSQNSAGGKPNSFQTKLYGQVKKPMMEKQAVGEKRKMDMDMEEAAVPISPSKKGRTGSIGLGIR